jgi:hypothetical protein
MSFVFALVPLCLRWNFPGERNLYFYTALVRSHCVRSFRGGIQELILPLVVLVLLFGGGGFYLGPPRHYFGVLLLRG